MTRLFVLSLALLPIACFKADDIGAEELGESGTEPTSSTESGGNESPTSTSESTEAADDPSTGASETSSEPYCGNGEIEPGETCDADNVGGMTCASFNHEKGEIICNTDCTLNIDGCYTCGDGSLDGLEICDGANLGNQTCISLGFMAGPLACSADCLVFETGACVPFPNCGNGQFDPGLEACEGDQLDGQTCESQGFPAGGTLACGPGCLFDTSGCAQCGNSMIEGNEACDGFDFGGLECWDIGPFDGGFLSCNPDCTLDTTDCCIGQNCQQW